MVIDSSVLGYFTNAGAVVKLVMLILLIASLASWTLIFQRSSMLRQARKAQRLFEDKFWSGVELTKLYADVSQRMQSIDGMKNIFVAGFKEFLRLHKQPGINNDAIMEGAERAMRIAQSRENDQLTQNLALLATIGSTSPYIGLFGTVWGIMTSFHALGTVSQATIAMVAPGISEALVATAMGLFAAIPAVIAYNRLSTDADRLLNHYETFQEEFTSILYRQVNKGVTNET